MRREPRMGRSAMRLGYALLVDRLGAAREGAAQLWTTVQAIEARHSCYREVERL